MLSENARWGIILAGGDGNRLLPFTQRITGDERPKQFCALTGGETLLDQTRRRVALMLPEDQTLLLLTQTHEPYYSSQLVGVASRRLVVQSYNHGTAPDPRQVASVAVHLMSDAASQISGAAIPVDGGA